MRTCVFDCMSRSASHFSLPLLVRDNTARRQPKKGLQARPKRNSVQAKTHHAKSLKPVGKSGLADLGQLMGETERDTPTVSRCRTTEASQVRSTARDLGG
jgi:hypothetical protein